MRVRKHSASTSPFSTWSPLLICPQHEMPAQESTTCRAGLSGAGRLSGDQEVFGLPCLALRPNWEDCGRRGGGVSCWCGQPRASGLWAPHTAQPSSWSALHRLALGTQPRNNGAIQAAWALHNGPLGLCRWLDGVG